MTRPRVLFYCQHSLGLGHLARSLRVARGLVTYFDVVLLNGGRFPAGVEVPAGVTVVNLPPLGLGNDNRLLSHDPLVDVERACALRRRMLLEELERAMPRIVLIEMYPFGRRKFEFELLPLLDAVAAAGPERPRVVCSLRDILVSQRREQARFDERVSQRANRSFDAILVHSDPRFTRLEDSFDPASPLRVPVHYTGFVAPPAVPARDRAAPLPRVLVSVGGGMVGAPLVRAAVDVQAALAARAGLSMTVVAGPFLPEPAWAWLQARAASSPGLTAVRRVDDLCEEMRRSAVSLSQGGYNTTMDVVRSGTPAVVVPYSDGAEDEQTRRAQQLAALGALHLLPAEELTGGRLLSELSAAAASRPSAVSLDLSGEATTARIAAELAGFSVAACDIRPAPALQR